MKNLRNRLMLGLFVSVGLVSQSFAAVTGASAPAVSTKPSSPIHLLSHRIMEQMVQVQRDVKAGKLTKDQGTTLQGQIKTVRVQEMTMIKQNGTGSTGSPQAHQLTPAQVTQLNGQLDGLSKQIP